MTRVKSDDVSYTAYDDTSFEVVWRGCPARAKIPGSVGIFLLEIPDWTEAHRVEWVAGEVNENGLKNLG